MSIGRKLFGKIADQEIYSYTITNNSGAYVEIIDYGCRIRQIAVPDIKGDLCNVVRCCNSPDGYLSREYEYDGAAVGRCANRIKGGTYIYDNTLYTLTKNEGQNHVHGGNMGFHNMMWRCISEKNNELIFSGFQSHRTEGYPGNIRLSLSFNFTEENELVINMTAQSDRDTIFNPTMHPFFNLNRPGTDASLHFLKIYSDKYTPLDSEGIPTGEILDIPPIMDFREPKRIKSGLKYMRLSRDLMNRGGYDHNYVLHHSPEGPVLAAELTSVESGRSMAVYTSSPGLQLYSGNFMKRRHSAVCLEPQFFPDAVNNRGKGRYWDDPIIKSGMLGKFDVRYKFSVISQDEIHALTKSSFCAQL